MAFDTPDINYFLGRKYAILQQQADTGTQSAATSAIAANAAAAVDRARALTIPDESKASIAQTGAQTNLLNEQASVVRPESQARISNLNANTLGTTVDAAVNYDLGVARRMPDGTLSRPALSSVFGPQGYQGFKFGSILPDAPRATTDAGVRVFRGY